jgi:hypothetical protein
MMRRGGLLRLLAAAAAAAAADPADKDGPLDAARAFDFDGTSTRSSSSSISMTSVERGVREGAGCLDDAAAAAAAADDDDDDDDEDEEDVAAGALDFKDAAPPPIILLPAALDASATPPLPLLSSSSSSSIIYRLFIGVRPSSLFLCLASISNGDKAGKSPPFFPATSFFFSADRASFSRRLRLSRARSSLPASKSIVIGRQNAIVVEKARESWAANAVNGWCMEEVGRTEAVVTLVGSVGFR